jgi:hypothetical protein
LKEKCLNDLKQRIIDKANLIQRRFEKVFLIFIIDLVCQLPNSNNKIDYYSAGILRFLFDRLKVPLCTIFNDLT